MPICHPAPTDKKSYITDIGQILVTNFGKKDYYTPDEVDKAHQKTDWANFDFSCWAMSTFSSHKDFDYFHEMTGENCDYAEMKTEMLAGLSDTVLADSKSYLNNADIDNSNASDIGEITSMEIDSSWLEFDDVFDGIFEGLGAFFGGILDGI